jgi:hypothetical protein
VSTRAGPKQVVVMRGQDLLDGGKWWAFENLGEPRLIFDRQLAGTAFARRERRGDRNGVAKFAGQNQILRSRCLYLQECVDQVKRV